MRQRWLGIAMFGALTWSCETFGSKEPVTAPSLSSVTRIGPDARKLTGDDLAAIERLLPPGKQVWLLMDRRFWDMAIGAYLPPTTSLPTLRRGTAIGFGRKPGIPDSTAWKLRGEPYSYAQVAIEGRSFDQILNDQDINRPFQVVGEFGDDELVDIVRALRSQPGIYGLVHLPVIDVIRQQDNPVVDVTFRGKPGGDNVQVRLRPQGTTWTVEDVSYFID